MELKVKLKEILLERNMTQKQLSQLTGLTETVISEIAINRRTSINRAHMTKIMLALNITDMNDLFELK